MKIKRHIFVISIVVLVSASQGKEILCKPRPGCLLTKCDPGNSLESLNTNEYPLTCTGTSGQDQASTSQYDELKKRLERLRTNMDANKCEIEKLKKSNADLVEENKLTKSAEADWRKKDNELSMAFQAYIGRSCHGARLESALSRNDSGGVFDFFIPTIGFRPMFCDVTDEGGNWTVFQRRMKGNVDFFRGWNDYVKGFGDLRGDFWFGLEALHQMTWEGNYELKISMIDNDGDRYFVKYSNFQIGPSSDKYRLTISGYSGNAKRNSLYWHNNRQFTTKDADHDGAPYSCAYALEGGWWYNDCADSNLNGNFKKAGNKRMWWRAPGGPLAFLRYTEMKFRRRF